MAAIAAPSLAAHQHDDEVNAYAETFEQLRRYDLRLATIGYGLARANIALCDRREPGTGLVVHGLAQYEGEAREAAKAYFGFQTPIGVLGTVPGSPAAEAGALPDDSLVTLGGVAAGGLPNDAPTTAVNALYDAIAIKPPAQPIALEVRRGEGEARLTIEPEPVCRTRFEVVPSNEANGEADGRMVQITTRILQEYSDEEAAVLIAHELAHNILRHKVRLNEADVDRGLFAEFGRNVGLFRQTEIEADVLSVHLLTNAGYRPELAAEVWRKFGPNHAGGLFRSRTHPDWQDRAATMAAEAAKIVSGEISSTAPPILASRDKPLDGDWRRLLVRD